MRARLGRPVAVAGAFVSLLAGNAQAQTSMRPLAPIGQVTVEVLHPALDGIDAASGVLFAGGSTRLGPQAALLFEVPVARLAFEVGDATSTAFGNPYIGALLPLSAASLELGVRLPLASKEELAGMLAIFSDLDRMEAFAPELATLRAIGRYTVMSEANGSTGVTFAAGPMAWWRTGDHAMDRTELLMSYGAHGHYEVAAVRVNAGATGRLIMTEPGSFSDRTMHQAVAGASIGSGIVRPGLQLSVPLERDRRDAANWALGLYVSVLLPR